MCYSREELEKSAYRLAASDWQDEKAAGVFSGLSKIMLQRHLGQHGLGLQPDIVDDIHQDWMLKLMTKRHLQQFQPGRGRTMYSYLYSGLRLHLLSVCLAPGRRYHWARPEVPISQLTQPSGETLGWDDIEPSAQAGLWGGQSDES